MIVLDASAAVELTLSLRLSSGVQEHLEKARWQIAAPELLTVEVIQVLRRRVLAKVTSVEAAEEAVDLLADVNIRFFSHQTLADRIWELRDNATAYDAAYLALAELLSAELLTADSRLAHSGGHAAKISLVS